MIKDRVTVQEAARRLGVKDDAIRKRIQRGSLEHDKDPDGRVYVYLDAMDATEDETHDGRDGTGGRALSWDAAQDAVVVAKDETISELRDQVDFMRRELERKDAILMSLTQRIPELEAPASPGPPGADPPGAPDARPGSSRDPAGGGGGAREGPEGPSRTRDAPLGEERGGWFRRFFGF